MKTQTQNKQVNVYNIDWNTDGEKVDLPLKYNFDIDFDIMMEDELDDDVLMDDYISNELSKRFGWLVNDYEYNLGQMKTQLKKETFKRFSELLDNPLYDFLKVEDFETYYRDVEEVYDEFLWEEKQDTDDVDEEIIMMNSLDCFYNNIHRELGSDVDRFKKTLEKLKVEMFIKVDDDGWKEVVFKDLDGEMNGCYFVWKYGGGLDTGVEENVSQVLEEEILENM